MSDYGGCDGGEYEDYAWFYVEEEYIVADDLAEHQVPSPPPSDYVDDDMRDDWDRYEYFNDLDYASDCYEDGIFQSHDAKDSKIGQKRKRATKSSRSKKKLKTSESPDPIKPFVKAHSPIVWRSQRDRVQKPRVLTQPTETFALFGDWRERFGDTSPWDRPSQPAKSPAPLGDGVSEAALSATSEPLDEDALAEDEDMEEDGDMEIGQEALMAALQNQLAAAGGPLSGMDPQQLLQFALRMAAGKDAGDDIAGEMADAMLGGEGEEDDEAKEEQLLSWVAQQRNANKDAAATEPESPEASRDSNRPPTPPLSQANRSVKDADTKEEEGGARSKTWTAQETKPVASNKRKAEDEEEASGSSRTTKRRVTRSFNAPTAASRAKAAPATTQTRNTRSKK
ncbi:hypothetical protein HBH56_001740 [Parastagonospora nodorum]|uniref:Uncharacterized protein n=2 Tax=Phaeosphaeria nodorum (strain SN15 / ATCC MYA-4574 / FGSC 10173) TaxID=321614 RepID=Q0UFB1_PHANO|nr:hypothetical protein SNOG_09553 [Parastagonospora nodorum SN15]KAH3920236.1 hypothetical protein HBH56_001740 [Parastagonospora nodorum]EAT82818.1 hypothetical protein SNOG_09553 [Parastagonospora nodorum SN15]KAH3938146.1 hypothetical protein HBH54_001750 [Parastagonospora nodorum]KAH3940838.1 hypothetical protein HBH53_211050 [Parastagonospora nodorum]KAH3956289.1 hypothetical protein HBH51_245710 [Parastagonospora nodorum]